MLIASPSESLSGSIALAGDKSISHRVVLLGALGHGTTVIRNINDGDDVKRTLDAISALGVRIQVHANRICIEGVGFEGLKTPTGPIDAGNSGTTARLLAGIIAATPGLSATIIGDKSLSRRPFRRITDPLSDMGAQMQTNDGCLPLHIQGQQLKPISYTLPIGSAQVMTAIMFASLNSAGVSQIIDPFHTRDHTQRCLQALHCDIEFDEKNIKMNGPQRLPSHDWHVPGDCSSAAFLIVAACITPNSKVCLERIGLNPRRVHFIAILQQMGADITITDIETHDGESYGTIIASYRPLMSIRVSGARAAWLIDEYPILFIAAASAAGMSLFEGLNELRHKESDRLGLMCQNLKKLGIDATIQGNDMSITGGYISGGQISAHEDHRIAMAFCVAGLIAEAPVHIDGASGILTSFTTFMHTMKKIGAAVEQSPCKKQPQNTSLPSMVHQDLEKAP